MFRICLRNGLFSGLLLLVYVNVLDRTRLIYTTTWGAYLGYLAILILPFFIFLSLKKVRQKEGKLKFLPAILHSQLIAFISAVVYNTYMAIDVHCLNAGHLKNQFEFTIAEMKKSGSSDLEINQRIQTLKDHYWSMQPYINTFVWYIILALIFACIFYFLFRIKFKTQ